jgi:predicted permease
LEAFLRDLAHAARAVRTRPLLPTVAALSVAIGIGANTAIFSIVNVLLLRPLPGIAQPERLVEVGRTNRGQGFDTFSYPDFLDLRKETNTFAGLAAFDFQSASVNAGGTGRRLMGMTVSANYFQILGVQPAVGRFFLPNEDITPGANAVIVISHRLWQDLFRSDPAVVGRTLVLSRIPFQVIGVAPATFHGHIIGVQPDFFVPVTMGPAIARESAGFFERRGSMHFLLIGALAPGVSIDRANAVTTTLMNRLQASYPETNATRGARVAPLGPVPAVGRDAVTAFSGALSGIVLLILLTICANVAGTLLVRATGRRKEIALRLALGSPRRRIVRQLVFEALIIFGLGGLGGLLIAWWGTAALSRVHLPVPIDVAFDLRPDAGVLLLGLGMALATGLAFGLLPALRVSNPALTPALHDAGGWGTRRAGAMRRAFIMVQVAASITLLAAAGLFLRALQHAASIPIGFDAERVYTTTLNLTLEGYTETEGRTFQDRLLERMHEIPGVSAAALSTDLPLDGESSGTDVIPDDWATRADSTINVDFNVVSPGYFTALRIRVLRGRTFDQQDGQHGAPAIVVDRVFAERTWPGADPIGRQLRLDESEPWRTVVGVVDRVPTQHLNERVRPAVYVPMAQHYMGGLQLIVRGARGTSVGTAIAPAIHALDPAVSITPVVSLVDYTSIAILPQRAAALLITALATLALFLCGLGIYGVIAHDVARRTREIGLRLAIGARPPDVLRLVFDGAARVALPGALLGAVAALGTGQVLRAFLLGLSPLDPVALGIAAGVLTLVVFAASLVPAARAARVQPMEALRHE